MNTEDKPTYWLQHFENWKNSGLSQRDYCKQHALTFSSFGYWRHRLKANSTAESKLIPITVSSPALINIYLPSGVRIDMPTHALADILPLLADEING